MKEHYYSRRKTCQQQSIHGVNQDYSRSVLTSNENRGHDEQNVAVSHADDVAFVKPMPTHVYTHTHSPVSDRQQEKIATSLHWVVGGRAALSIWWALRTSVSCLPVNAALVGGSSCCCCSVWDVWHQRHYMQTATSLCLGFVLLLTDAIVPLSAPIGDRLCSLRPRRRSCDVPRVNYDLTNDLLLRFLCIIKSQYYCRLVLIQRVKWRHRVYGHDTIAILWV